MQIFLLSLRFFCASKRLSPLNIFRSSRDMNGRKHLYLTLESRRTSPVRQCWQSFCDRLGYEATVGICRVAEPLLAMSSGQKWMLGGLGVSSVISMVGGTLQGWPMLALMRESDQMMVLCLMGVASVLVLMIGVVSIAALRSSQRSRGPPEGADALIWAQILQEQKHRRRRRR